MRRAALVMMILAAAAPRAAAQEQPDPRTLIPAGTLNAIAQHVSGAQAHFNVLEMCPYERNRPPAEYQGTYREATYAEARAKEYGFSDVHIERFPLGSKQWDGEMAELWVTEPGPPELITSYRDVTATLATGSRSGDVTADLIYVGRGDKDEDYAGKDVKGRIVLCSGPVGAAHNLAVRTLGAEGVVSFYNGTGKPVDRPDQIAWSGISAGSDPSAKTTWGFILSLRMGLDLLARLEKHADLAAHAVASVSTDMVGANQTINHNSLHLNQTPYSIPSVLNDVSRQFFEYVGDTNREKLHNRRIAYAFANPILDPQGTRDPFWYHIEKFYGSSDHQVHLDWEPRIPAVQFGNWPDAVYHSSDDSPANQDPTQMKRAAFLMVTIGSVFANAGPDTAVSAAEVALGYAGDRLAGDLRNALLLIATSGADTLNDSYKEALNVVTQAYIRERAAAKVFVSKVPGKEPPRRRRPQEGPPPPLSGYYAMEARNWADGQHSLLDIRNALSAEFGPIGLEKVDQFFQDGEKAGFYTRETR